jgi:molybdopterin-guanine dinucleotide biosynthesis protein MobB
MLFHPFEIAFCGYSGSGKTTLVAALVRALTETYSIAYYKHGCHRFDMDREGKDSWILRKAGAGTVMIADPEKQAIITDHRSGSSQLERQAFSDSDLLFVEGLKELPLQKLILVDTDRRILELIRNGMLTSVAALIVPDDPGSYAAFGMPVYQRDSVREIAGFIETLLLERSSKEVPLFGLVLAGGHSSRMGSDKALIEYHTATQLEHATALLQKQCGRQSLTRLSEFRSLPIAILISDPSAGFCLHGTHTPAQHG